MLEEQDAALKQITDYVKERQADAVLLSGDLYDRSVPPAAAVTMFDLFLTGLSELGVTGIMTAGSGLVLPTGFWRKEGCIWKGNWKIRCGLWIFPTSGEPCVCIWRRLPDRRR